MSAFSSALTRFTELLEVGGYPRARTWLPGDSMILTSDWTLRLRHPKSPLQDSDLARPGALAANDEGTLMLVATTDVSYVTLLMDTFGSCDESIERSGPFYLWPTPYIEKPPVIVESGPAWVWLRLAQRLSPTLSSLDYAFGLAQTRPN